MSTEALKTLVDGFVEELQPFVDYTENKLSITQDNYGDYLSLLSGFEGNSMKFVVAIALIKCGAPENGVISALKLLTQEWGEKLEAMFELKTTMQ